MCADVSYRVFFCVCVCRFGFVTFVHPHSMERALSAENNDLTLDKRWFRCPTVVQRTNLSLSLSLCLAVAKLF